MMIPLVVDVVNKKHSENIHSTGGIMRLPQHTIRLTLILSLVVGSQMGLLRTSFAQSGLPYTIISSDTIDYATDAALASSLRGSPQAGLLESLKNYHHDVPVDDLKQSVLIIVTVHGRGDGEDGSRSSLDRGQLPEVGPSRHDKPNDWDSSRFGRTSGEELRSSAASGEGGKADDEKSGSMHYDCRVYQSDAVNDYILDRRDVYILIISNQVNIDFEIKIEEQKGAFARSLGELVSLIGQAKIFRVGEKPMAHYRLIKVKPEAISPPCSVSLKVGPRLTKEFHFQIHEANRFVFHVGITSTSFSVNQFSLSNDTIVAKLDSTGKKEWKGNMIVMLMFRICPRDVDRFRPIWTDVFGCPDDDARDGWYRDLWQRFGIFAGLKLSSDPLEAIYAGVSFSVTRDLDVIGGATWVNEIAPTVQKVGNITSIADAESFLRRRYSSPKMFWGLSLDPGAISRALGFSK